MSDTNGLMRIVPDPPRPERQVTLDPSQAIPHRTVELVSDEEQRHDEQVKHRAELPQDFFKRTPKVEPPLAPGATVNLETMLGFLAAMETILPPDSNYPILTSAKIWYDAPNARLYLEAGSHAVWTAVALKVITGSEKGFEATMPIKPAKNILMALRDRSPTVVVGVDAQGVCLGPHTVPFGGPLDDFPDQPVMHEWVARAAMPSTYFRDICTRVLPARSDDFEEIALQGALLDFEFMTIDAATRPLCTVVATDKNRIHILRLPQMHIEVKQVRIRALPPTCTVSAGFFHYMKEIIQHEWAALEICEDQVIAKGEDFVVVAKTSVEARTSLTELSSWRKINIDWNGYWLVVRTKLVDALKLASLAGTAEECRLQVDHLRDALTVSSSNTTGERFSTDLPVRGADGSAIGDIKLSIKYLLDALAACSSGLVRLAFTHDVKAQQTSPVVIRGEDEQFKAIIMPRI